MAYAIADLIKDARHRNLLGGIVDDLTALNTAVTRGNRTIGSAKLAAGTTAGKIKTQAAIDFQINGQLYTKAITDDCWDLSGETRPAAASYAAWWLYLDSSGVATFSTKTADCATASAAVLALPDPSTTKSVIGAYVSAVHEDMAGALVGTFYNGYPSARYLTGISGVSLGTSKT